MAHFEAVIATDASDEQIRSAEPVNGVEFRVANAEASGIDAVSVDLVTVAQALHWFDIDAFFAEADRVLKPGGVLAFWCYQHCAVDDKSVMETVGHFLDEVEPYWPAERSIVEEQYPTIETPFADLPVGRFAMVENWTARELLAYIRTWSAVQRYLAAYGRDPIDIHEAAFLSAWGDGRREVRWPIVLRACRKAET